MSLSNSSKKCYYMSPEMKKKDPEKYKKELNKEDKDEQEKNEAK